MAAEAANDRQDTLTKLLHLKNQICGLEQAWTTHIGIIDEHEHVDAIEMHEHPFDIKHHDERQNLKVPRITRSNPREDSLTIISDRIRSYTWRIETLRFLKAQLGPEMDIDADRELASASRGKHALLKLQAKIDELEGLVGIMETDRTQAIEELRGDVEQGVKTQETQGLETSALLDILRRARAMGLRV